MLHGSETWVLNASDLQWLSGWSSQPWPSRSQNWMFVYFIIILSRSQQFPTSSSQNQVELGEWATGHFMHWWLHCNDCSVIHSICGTKDQLHYSRNMALRILQQPFVVSGFRCQMDMYSIPRPDSGVYTKFSGRLSEEPFPWLIQKFPCILIFKTGQPGCQLNLSEGLIKLDLTSGRPLV